MIATSRSFPIHKAVCCWQSARHEATRQIVFRQSWDYAVRVFQAILGGFWESLGLWERYYGPSLFVVKLCAFENWELPRMKCRALNRHCCIYSRDTTRGPRAAPLMQRARTGHSTWHSFLTCWVNQEETPHVHLYCINKQKAMKADSVRAKLCGIHRIEEHSNNDSFAMDDSWPFDSFDTAELGPSRGAVSSRVWDHRVHGSDCSRCCHLAG